MKRGWEIVLIIVVFAIVLGGLGVGVGVFTGADMSRIYSVLDDRYSIGMYWQYAQEVVKIVQESL